MRTTTESSIRPSSVALLPLLLFLTIFIGTGFYLTSQDVDFAFYQLPAPIAILPAIVLAILLSREKLNTAISQFINGVSHPDIISMCLIYLLAGAFAAVAKASGGVDATVNLGLTLLPGWLILPGLFLIAAFISTSMGTSMGTIAAIAPVALGIAEKTGIDPALMAGVVMSGAMFGDNLSIISDTTIAATRSQGCEMRDKFRENFRIALPAALVVFAIFAFANEASETPVVEKIDILAVIPYLTILALAVYGLNVFVVLSLGIVLAALAGFASTGDFAVMEFGKTVYQGFSNMQEIFLLSLLIGGLAEMMRQQGGLAFITQKLNSLIGRSTTKGKDTKAGELGIAALVSLANVSTANNTVAIIVSGGVARSLAEENEIDSKRSASLLDIFSCVVQGLLPYGAQALLLGSTFGLSPLEVVSHSWYCLLLAVSAVVSVWLTSRKKYK
ncbi:Na+/H+ antiporter NhaC family protein [Veronia pacifica]|uniref:Sodium:proton antiporter n=1 Tax=Veronia pacifica TaxID=1080227 RepID=A0A1C3EF52_9GAMM|nr:Na+/H+ antiporter NhaC family protein [Veronia pacifica]ODA31853.1 sodium:proton antiporter [Veronia pacifica]